MGGLIKEDEEAMETKSTAKQCSSVIPGSVPASKSLPRVPAVTSFSNRN